MEKNLRDLGLYPVVVRQSRYSGIYEGGLWFAIPNHEEMGLAEQYVDYLYGDDCDAVDFWDSELAKTFGVGNTPNEAVADLIKKHGGNDISDIENSEYMAIRNQFESVVEERKESVIKNPSITSEIHLERTAYFERSSGYKNDDKLL